MNFQRIVVGSVVCLIWWTHEILSNPINEKNMTDIIMVPFTINANPLSYENKTTKTLNPVYSTPKPPPEVTERIVKTVPTPESKQFVPTVVSFPKNHKPSFQPHTEPGSIEVIRGKHQKWQIPSPIQFTTPNPKETNSSKRQTLTEKFSYPEFIPSREIGSYDNTEGFVPKIHQPKTISFLQNVLNPNKQDTNSFDVKEISNKQGIKFPDNYIKYPPRVIPTLPSNKKFASEYSTLKNFSNIKRNKNNKKKTSSGNRKNSNRRQGLMEEFQKDFDKLVGKYPELGDLINEYPVMEEIMKQKLTKIFQNSDEQRQFSEEQYDEDDGDSEEGDDEEDDDKLKFNVNQALPLKFTNYKFQSDEESNVNIYGDNPQTFDGAPYPFDGKKPSWSYKKKPDHVPSNVPAGGYYQNSKFPDIDDHKSNNKNLGEDNPLNIDIHERPPISPWKRAMHMLTAFLPVGLLISALTPNVINISNSSDQAYVVRQRSADWNGPPSQLQEKLQGKFQDLENLRLFKDSTDDPICDDWNFCEMAKKGDETDAVGVEKMFWQLAHEVPEHIAEKNGMKKLFKAIKSKDCSQFPCKINSKPVVRISEENLGNPDTKEASLAKDEDVVDSKKDVGLKKKNGSNTVKRDDPFDKTTNKSLNYTPQIIGVF